MFDVTKNPLTMDPTRANISRDRQFLLYLAQRYRGLKKLRNRLPEDIVLGQVAEAWNALQTAKWYFNQ